MDDVDFFSLLQQHWAKTTGAEDTYWMDEPYDDHSGRNRIYAVAQDDSRKLIASDLSDKDADFITALHGCVPDLVRRLLDAVDEADRLDLEKDDLVNRVGRLEQEADEYASMIDDLTREIERLESGRV